MTFGKIFRLFVLILLIAATYYIYTYIQDDLIAAASLAGALVVFWIYHKIARSALKRSKWKFANKTRKQMAKVLGKGFINKRTMIVQLELGGSERYVASYIEHNPSESQKGRFVVGHTVPVYVNPRDKYDVFIKDAEKTSSPRRSRRVNFWVIFWVLVSFGPALIPLIISLFNTSDRVFQDAEFIKASNEKNYIWEIRYKQPRKIFFRIFNPQTGNKIKSWKETKTEDLETYTKFFISTQGENVVVVGLGATPVFDIYNCSSFEKVAGIDHLLNLNDKMKSGIANLQIRSVNPDFGSYDILDITTNDGNNLYYNINQNKFYKNNQEINDDLYKYDIEFIEDNLIAFVLARVEDNNYQKHLYAITAKSKKYIDKLLNEVGSENFYIKNFERQKRYNCKYCDLQQLSKKPFLKSELMYYDTSIAVVGSLVSLEQKANEEITCINKEGNIVFHIPEKHYPNYEEMEDDYYTPYNRSEIKFTRLPNQLIIMFGKYGALCFDLTTGIQLWKWER